jgi:hypothetical protein
VEVVTLKKKGNSLGLSIVAAKVKEKMNVFISSIYLRFSRVNLNNFKEFISKQLYQVVQRKMMDVFKLVIRYFVLIK